MENVDLLPNILKEKMNRLDFIKGDNRDHPPACNCDVCWLLREIGRLNDVMSSPKVNVHIDISEIIKGELAKLQKKIDAILEEFNKAKITVILQIDGKEVSRHVCEGFPDYLRSQGI